VIVTRLTILGAILIYVFLWVVAINGASSLVAPLLIPLVLAVLVAAGVALNRYMGITPRKQHFQERDDPDAP
jgi:Mg2+/citrate symporter